MQYRKRQPLEMPSWAARLRAEAEYADAVWRGFLAFLDYCRSRGASPESVDATAVMGAYAYKSALNMVTGVLNTNTRTWREAARKSGQGELIHQTLCRDTDPATPLGLRYHGLVEQNSKLISSFPNRVAQTVSARAAEAQSAGVRSAALQASDPLFLSVGRARARLVARTEVSKASVALTEARSEEMGLPWYVWRSSHDERVRLSHRRLDGVLFRWDDPPSPEALAGEKSTLGTYNAGNAPNCRCYPEPVVDARQVTWPHRAYLGGRIRPITLAEFKRIA